MFQQMKKRIKNEKGLTLIELLAVIVILAIIAAIAIPAIGNIINNSRDKAILSESLNIISGAKIAHMESKCGDAGCDEDDIKEFVDGVKDADLTGVKVTLGTTGWTIDYGKFTDIKNDKFKVKDKTETEIKGLLDKAE